MDLNQMGLIYALEQRLKEHQRARTRDGGLPSPPGARGCWAGSRASPATLGPDWRMAAQTRPYAHATGPSYWASYARGKARSKRNKPLDGGYT